MSRAAKFELCGMFFLLAAAAFQLFILDTVTEVASEAAFYRVEEKLDTIWEVLADLYSHSDRNSSEVISSVNFKAVVEGWKEWDQGMKDIKSQREWFSYISGGVFLFGSFLVIAGRYLDAKRS